ncbi:MAG TPA: sugar ABC transporter ATP-binding protein [Vicinamibacteria bacterium]|nr:sugar ABC transporter ATP-binding protein [Vicinamibacteria bacterium]
MGAPASPLAADAPPAVSMRGIRKAFPGVVALDGVDFDVRRGEVHVLLGENGAGKSTLMRVLSGATAKDAGEIRVDGRPVEIQGPRHAQALGVGTIYQELTLVPQLSAAENIFLGKEPVLAAGVIDRARLRRDAAALLAGLGVEVDPGEKAGGLGIAQQQMVEVAKALSSEPRLLVMDEPTSALTERETEQLFDAIARLTAKGVAVVYISHRLDEVARIGNRVSVLRDGRHVATHRVGDVSVAELIRLMANRELKEHFPKRRAPRGPEVLRVEGLRRGRLLRDVSFSLHRGEVLGVAGLLGAGRTEMARAVLGADRREGGRITIKGDVVDVRSPADAFRRGVGLLPEDRKTQGLVLGLSVRGNVALPSARRLSRLGVVDAAGERSLVRRWVDELRVKAAGLEQEVGRLSGGNQQKVVLAKWLAAGVDVLLMDEPTRGIDVGAKVEIYELMNRLTAQGAGIVMITSELPELLGMSDRILVMHQGRVQAELRSEEATQERVLRAALGHDA